ncbi:MAG: hypothetical protein ABSG84_17470 [Acidobacteriaceae bacterium]
MAKSVVCKSTLALVLVLLIAGIGKSYAQQAPAPIPPTFPTPDDPGGGTPPPPDPGGGTPPPQLSAPAPR